MEKASSESKKMQDWMNQVDYHCRLMLDLSIWDLGHFDYETCYREGVEPEDVILKLPVNNPEFLKVRHELA